MICISPLADENFDLALGFIELSQNATRIAAGASSPKYSRIS
jgi:hypothetical protein